MLNMDFVRQRLSEIIAKKDTSASEYSYQLGHSRNYLNNILSGHSNMPVADLLYLLELLHVAPHVFFDVQQNYSDPVLAMAILDDIGHLSESDLEAVAHMTRQLRNRNM